MTYGRITPTDGQAIEHSITKWRAANPAALVMRYLEVGPFCGDTVRGVKAFAAQNGIPIDCWGVDMTQRCDPNLFGPGQFVIQTSESAYFDLAPRIKEVGGLDVIFIDACHCRNHVILDACNYGDMLNVGGFIMFHDSVKSQQGVMMNPWIHGEGHAPVWRTGVVDAFRLLGWPDGVRWVFEGEWCDQNDTIGGIMVFRKVAT